jgi:hypothetical protein
MRKYITSILCTLVCSSVVHADGKEKTLYAAVTPESSRWQQTSAAMTASDYQRSVSNNQAIVQRQLQTYSERLLDSAGAYGPAIGLFGAAIAVAATDTRYNLNDSKTMGMVFRDTTGSDRSVLIEYRKYW